MPLTISEVTAERTLPSVSSAIAYLEKQPADQVFTPEELARAIGVAMTYLRSGLARSMPNNHIVLRARSYYGSKRAIANLRKKLGVK